MKKIFFILSVIIGFTACTEKQEKNTEECMPCKNKENMATIKSFEKISKDHKAFQKLTQTASFQKMSNRKDYTLIVDSAFIITFDETDIKTIIIPYDTKEDQTNLKIRYLMSAFIEDNNYITDSYIIEIREKSETIPSSEDNIKIFCDEGSILYDITKKSDKSIEINQGTCGLESLPGGFTNCVRAVLKRCNNDPECFKMCGYNASNGFCWIGVFMHCAEHYQSYQSTN